MSPHPIRLVDDDRHSAEKPEQLRMSASSNRREKAGDPAGPQSTADGSDSLRSLAQVLLTSEPGAPRVRRWTDDIGQRLLVTSPYAREPNFTRLHVEDLSFLFAAYDRRFLNGLCTGLLDPEGVTFRLSSRMTRAGGKTTRFQRPDGTGHFEIAVATSILFDGFAADDPEVSVCGLPCQNRLEALQRLFEHEIVHLAEWLCWDVSNCGHKRFQGIATRLFRHRAHTHQLITPTERAAQLGFTVGSRVKFRYQGRWLKGRVNRITKRATVLIDDPTGELMSDGRRYVRYYVPLGELSPVLAEPARDSRAPRWRSPT